MNQEIEKHIKDLTIDYLSNHNIGNRLEKAVSVFEKLHTNIVGLANKEEEAGITGLKVITVMTFSVLKKIGEGKNIQDFSKQDWSIIVDEVSQYAIIQDETQYVLSVFHMYEKYIRASADYVEQFASEQKVAEIRLLADEIEEKTTLLKEELISEVSYIEQCLWIALEAMIKLIAASAAKIMVEEYADLAYALAAYAFEYGRMTLYKREQELINEYVQSQYILDGELQEKYNQFIEMLNAQSKQFILLVDNAFTPAFREQFLGSANLAKSLGVSEKEILTTVDKIDSFFED